MRVAHIIDNLSPGGTERQCLELVRGLSVRATENAVLYFRTGSLLEEFRQLDATIRSAPGISFRSPLAPLRLMELARLVRQSAPQVVQTYGFYSNLSGLSAACIARVPVRVASRRELVRYLGRGQRAADRLAWKLAHGVVANSEAVRQQLIIEDQVNPGRISVIRNGLDVEKWPPPCERTNSDDGVVVGMVAHFREQKDHLTFLRAAREILRVVPAVRFCLIGSGPLETSIRETAERLGVAPRIDFLGALDRKALGNAVRRWRVSVLTSKDNEGLPNAVLESMAAGLPVVATAVGGTSEILDDGETGFLVAAGDSAALASRVVHLLKEPVLALAMGERARRKVEREFNVNRMVDQFLQLYTDLLAVRNRGR